jgi:molybdenum cofactor biosynthesis enzyme
MRYVQLVSDERSAWIVKVASKVDELRDCWNRVSSMLGHGECKAVQAESIDKPPAIHTTEIAVKSVNKMPKAACLPRCDPLVLLN